MARLDRPIMDPLLHAAATALATGNPLRALNCVALREDAHGLALRGIAMAQLGELPQARKLLKRAAGAFGSREPLAQARCVVAQAEIALVSRDLGWSETVLEAARAFLCTGGDVQNAAHAAHLQARKHLLLGRLSDAERALRSVETTRLQPARLAAHEMIQGGIATQRLHLEAAHAAYARALQAAIRAGIPAMVAEMHAAMQQLAVPVARHLACGSSVLLKLEGVRELLASDTLVVDACRRVVRRGRVVVPLASRPVLFALARALAEAWPHAVPRAALVAAAFQARRVDDSHRARLRVEVGRLRRLLRSMAEVQATPDGFMLRPQHGAPVGVLTWPAEEPHGAVLAFLADGEAWSSSALALALGASQRTVQRGLDALAKAGRVQSFGHGRARRWTSATVPGFTTTMLLPALLPPVNITPS